MTQNAQIEKVKTFDFSDPRNYNRAYIPLFANKSEFLHLFGSAGSGKSRFEAQKETALSFQSHRRNRKTLVVRKVFNTLKDSCYSELKTVIYEWNLDDCFDILKSPLQITNKITGVTFIFLGLDDIEKVKSISGVDRIWIEEATELTSQNELDQLRLRLRGFDEVQITLSYNPINVHHWLNTEIHQNRPAAHYIFKSTYRDNEKMLAVDPNYAPAIEALKDTNPNYYKVYGLGEWGQNSEGLIYPDYAPESDMPEAQFYGLDFGFNHPCALIAGAVQDNFNSLKKDYFVKELLYETHLTSTMLIDRMNNLGVDRKKYIIADSSRPEMIEDLKQAGFNVKACTKYKGSVVEGINAVKKYNLKLVAGGKDLFREIQNYSWKEKDGRFMDDEPVDAVNHLMDAMRYGIETQLRPFEVTDREQAAFRGMSMN